MPELDPRYMPSVGAGVWASFTLGLLAVLCALLAYGWALDGPLFFDDVPNLTANKRVQISGAHFDDWRAAVLSSNAGQLKRPISMLSFVVNHVLASGFSPLALKFTNLAIHIANALLVYGLGHALLKTPAASGLLLGREQLRLVALFGAVIWLLHPMHVSTVLYVVQRMAQLSALFVLAGLLVFTRYRLRWAQSGASVGDIMAAGLWLLLFTTLAALSKENGALLPWLILVVEVTLFRGEWRGGPSPGLGRLGWCLLVLPVIALAALFHGAPDIFTEGFSRREFTLQERLFTQGRVLWHYVDWLLLPNLVELGFFHDDIPLSRDLWAPKTTALSLLSWLGVLMAALWLRARYPLLIFALLFFLVAHSMESSFVALEMAFEHRNYLPSVGVCLLLAATVFRIAKKIPRLRLRVMGAGILIVWVVLLAIRTAAWRNEITLARYTIINHPASPRANFFFANALFKRFEQAEALALSDKERQDLAVKSRLYFVRMHTLDERSFAALVMLYQLDAMHFPGLLEEGNWLGKLEHLASSRRLQSSDITALGALVNFSAKEPGQTGFRAVANILDTLIERYPRRVELITLRYDLLAGRANVDHDTLREFLQRASITHPGKPEIYAYYLNHHGNQDMGDTIEIIKSWMMVDTNRGDLPLIRRIFDN